MRLSLALFLSSIAFLLSSMAVGQVGYSGSSVVGLEEDPRFNTKVASPAYKTNGPHVLFYRRYAKVNLQEQFFKLLKADGYRISEEDAPLTFRTLGKHDVLVFIEDEPLAMMNKAPAVAEDEASAIHDWVKAGGALLVASNGTGAEVILRRFHMDVEGSRLFYQQGLQHTADGQLLFDDKVGALANHPLLSGRDPSERVHRLVMMSPETASVPEGGVSLLVVPPETTEEFPPTREEQLEALRRAMALRTPPPATSEAVGVVLEYGPHRPKRSRPMLGRAPLVAVQYGKGRLVYIGNPNTIAAQVLSMPIKVKAGSDPSAVANAPTTKAMYIGMSFPDADNRQFALNVLHWLSKALN